MENSPIIHVGPKPKNDVFMEVCFHPTLQGDPIMILAEIRNLIILSVDINMGKKEFLDTAGRGGVLVVVVYIVTTTRKSKVVQSCKTETAMHCVCLTARYRLGRSFLRLHMEGL